MQTQFTLHCIPWQARASMLQQVRALACEIGLLSRSDAQTDAADECYPHALVLSESGKAMGCARITPYGTVERMAVLPHEDREQIEKVLQLAAWLHAKNTLRHA